MARMMGLQLVAALPQLCAPLPLLLEQLRLYLFDQQELDLSRLLRLPHVEFHDCQ